MKKLFIIRHAKSDWQDITLDDYDRPLNEKGEKNAPFMGKLLKEKNIRPDIIIASPAKRTMQTAELIAKEIGFEDGDKLVSIDGEKVDLISVFEGVGQMKAGVISEEKLIAIEKDQKVLQYLGAR